MPSDEVLRTRVGDFAALVDGPADGPPVLLLHGFPELNVSWRYQLPALAAAGYRVVAPNLRGYPGSVRGGSYAPEALAGDVVAMIDALGAERAVVVGHDWGGAVAWTAARLHPERVAALAALNCPPFEVLVRALVRDRQQLRRSWYVLFFQLPVLPERLVVANMPGTLVAGSYNRAAWDRALLAPYARAFRTPADARGPITYYRHAMRRGLRPGRRRAPRIELPVLVLWGVHDRFLGRDLVSPEALLSTLAYGNEAEVHSIETAGHFVQNEAPDEVNEALLGWLARVVRPSAADG